MVPSETWLYIRTFMAERFEIIAQLTLENKQKKVDM